MYIPLNANLQRTLHDKMLRIWSHGAAQGGCISAFDRWLRCLPPSRRLHHKSSRSYPGEGQRHHSADRDATGLYVGGFSALIDNQYFFTFWDRTEVAFNIFLLNAAIYKKTNIWLLRCVSNICCLFRKLLGALHLAWKHKLGILIKSVALWFLPHGKCTWNHENMARVV